MKTKQYAALAIVAVAAGAFLALNPLAQSAAGKSQPMKLEGAWVAKVPGMPMQWAYTLTPDPSGRRAAMVGSIHVAIPPLAYPDPGLFSDLDYQTDMVGEVEMTGNDTADFTAVWYGMKKDGLVIGPFTFDKVVYIGTTSGQFKFTGPGKGAATHNIAIYLPSTDSDGDGLPDPGSNSAACLPAMSIDTRVGLMPPCTP